MKFAATLTLTMAVGLAPVFAADSPTSPKLDVAATSSEPQRTEIELEPAGAAPGTTVREARIRQNWLLLGLGSAALAGIIFGLAGGSSSGGTTTTN